MEQDLQDRRCTHNYLTEDSQIIIVKLEEIYRKIKDIVFEGVTEEVKKDPGCSCPENEP